MGMAFQSADTIAALCTPAPPSTCGVLRLSGPEALAIAHALTGEPAPATKPARGARAVRVELVLHEKTYRCPALLVTMPGPHSYTCEDTAEFILPGSRPLLQALLRESLRRGARMAEGGEFTYRAFLRGRLDLGQAEAVEKIVRAETDAERRAALGRLEDDLPRTIESWRGDLTALAAELEAVLDFEEEEIGDQILPGMIDRLQALARACKDLAERGEHGTLTPEAIHIAVIGMTNADKSSLINALTGESRSLVADEPGTTRDRLSHPLTIGRFSFRLDDLPGFDPAADTPARDGGHARSTDFAAAPLVCLVLDASVPQSDLPGSFGAALRGKRVVALLHKCDRPAELTAEAVSGMLQEYDARLVATLQTSAVSGEGLQNLKDLLLGEALGDEDLSGLSRLTQREAEQCTRAAEACEAAGLLLEAGDVLCAAEEIRTAHGALSSALGLGYAEEVLTAIFSRFCVGK